MLRFMGSQRVRDDLPAEQQVCSLYLFIYFACVESSLRHMGLVASLHVGS